jgi:hypothetical protein
MKGNADRNASLVIGQRLVARYQKSSKEKPHSPLIAERAEQSAGVVISQEAKSVGTPSILTEAQGMGITTSMAPLKK